MQVIFICLTTTFKMQQNTKKPKYILMVIIKGAKNCTLITQEFNYLNIITNNIADQIMFLEDKCSLRR